MRINLLDKLAKKKIFTMDDAEKLSSASRNVLKVILSRLEKYPLKPTYGMADLKLFCVSRLFFNNYIDNIQCSWVKLGPKFAQISLNYGVNDFSGTLMEENISRSAGAEYGEYLSPDEMIRIIKAAGKHPAQRDTLYNILEYY